MFHLCNLQGGPFRNYFSAFIATFRADIDNPVTVFDDIKIMFDDNNAVAFVNKLAQNFEQVLDILEVKSSGGLVKNIEGFSGLYFGEF